MALKNASIATANPSAIANKNYINALYKEAYNRNATQAELNKFSGKTVKDSANLILGSTNSPFSATSLTPAKVVSPTQTKTVTPEQKKQLDVVASKPVDKQTETDKKNIEYATKNLGYVVPEKKTDIASEASSSSSNNQLSETPSYDYKTDPEYVSLSPENKAIIDTMNEAVNANDKESAIKAQYALQEAQKVVDPYTKVTLAFALNSIPDEFRIEKMSQEQKLKNLQDNLADVTKLMKNAPIEQQREMNALARDFENNISTIQDNMANAGLTYSTKRADLEGTIAAQNKDIITAKSESFAEKSKQYERSQADLEKSIQLQKEVAQANLKNMAASTEAKVGTDKFKSLGLTDYEGKPITAVGGTGETPSTPGSIESDRQAQILNLASKIGEYQSPTAIKNLFNA